MADNSLQESEKNISVNVDHLKTILRTTVPIQGKTSKKSDGTKKSVLLYCNRTLDFAAPVNSYDEVYPGILIGGQYLAREKREMKFLGITHVVNCAQGEKFAQIDTNEAYYADLGVRFHGIRATDVSTFKMLPHLYQAADFIAEALDNNGLVFVHCHMGMSRSATVVLAYLMIKKGMDVETALKTIRLKRAVWPNDGFLKQICTLNEELVKKRSMREEKSETVKENSEKEERSETVEDICKKEEETETAEQQNEKEDKSEGEETSKSNSDEKTEDTCVKNETV